MYTKRQTKCLSKLSKPVRVALGCPTLPYVELVLEGYAVAGKPKPDVSNPTYDRMCGYLSALKRWLKTKKEKKLDFSDDTNVKIARFYRSYDWQKARYTCIKKHGRKCLVCGHTPPEVKIHVDHIKGLRKHWDLRLDPENHQPLCENCNHGKGNWDETDWRGDGIVALN